MIISISILLINILSLIFLVGCSPTMICNIISCVNSSQPFHVSISSAEANDLMNLFVDDDSFIILDVRTSQEYQDGHIANAELINFYGDDFVSLLNELDKEKTYFIYCRSGKRSQVALMEMKSLGFVKVYNLKRGFIDWHLNGYEVKE